MLLLALAALLPLLQPQRSGCAVAAAPGHNTDGSFAVPVVLGGAHTHVRGHEARAAGALSPPFAWPSLHPHPPLMCRFLPGGGVQCERRTDEAPMRGAGAQPTVVVSARSAARGQAFTARRDAFVARMRCGSAPALRWSQRQPQPMLQMSRQAGDDSHPAVDTFVLRSRAGGSVVRVTRLRAAARTFGGGASAHSGGQQVNHSVRIWHAHLHSRHRRGMCALVALLTVAALCIVCGAGMWLALVAWFTWRAAAQCAECVRGSTAYSDSESDSDDEDVTAALICKSAGDAARRRSERAAACDGALARAHGAALQGRQALAPFSKM